MVEVNQFFKLLRKNNINFFSGVPDSVLKSTNNFFDLQKNHYIASNEGLAASMCIGYHLSTGKIGCLYLQNSGLSNAINPLISIAHKKVYSIPLFLLIGWRGAPGTKDEPQHQAKGQITKKLLKNLDIKYCELKNKKDFKTIEKLIRYSKNNNSPVACLVKKNILFNKNKNSNQRTYKGIIREDFIKILLKTIKNKTKIISTTGYTSRELYQVREKYELSKGKDFYMVGGMGHASAVALGSSLYEKNEVICLDGDGAFLMHMGSMPNIGFYGNKNFKHILLNNNCHESVGNQKTNIEKIKLSKIALASGYKKFYLISKTENIKKTLKRFLNSSGPSFLEVKIKNVSMKNLRRPDNFKNLKRIFMKH